MSLNGLDRLLSDGSDIATVASANQYDNGTVNDDVDDGDSIYDLSDLHAY